MHRFAFATSAAVALVLTVPGLVAAQDTWPVRIAPFARGPGDYLAWYKLLTCWILFLVWVRTTDWINRDAHEVGSTTEMPPEIWNPIAAGTFFVAMLLCLSIPMFPVGLLVLIAATITPLSIYIIQRNSRVTDDDKVLTPNHIKNWFASLGKKKKHVEPKAMHEAGPAIDLIARGAGSDQEDQANLITARQSPGFVTAKELIADALDKRSERIMLDYTRDSVTARYEVDGLWHNVPPRDRESGDVMLAVLKKISALKIDERRARQDGEFAANYRGNKFVGKITSQGTKTGERVIIQVVGKETKYKSLEELGMREKVSERLRAHLGGTRGLVLMSAIPAGGLTTTWSVALAVTDRYLRDFVAIEDSAKPKPYVENVEVVKYNAAAGEGPDKHLRQVLLKQPDVIVVPDLHNANTVQVLCEQVLEENKLVVSSVRAKEAVEALIRVMLLKAPPELFASAVTCVTNQRLARRLCTGCRQPFEPSPQLLQKLGIPQGRVSVLYREFQFQPGQGGKKEPEICELCGGIGYRGRIAMYELLEIDDQLRQTMIHQPRVESLRQAARQAGCRSLQEEGVLLVAQGLTSLNELQRVLKQ